MHTRRMVVDGPLRPRRQGMASVEFVMSAPLLVFMSALIFYFGSVSLKAFDGQIQARQTVWLQREQSGQAEDVSLPQVSYLYVNSPTPKGKHLGPPQTTVLRPHSLYFIKTPQKTLMFLHGVLSFSWDYTQLQFDPNQSPTPLISDQHDAAFGKQINITDLTKNLPENLVQWAAQINTLVPFLDTLINDVNQVTIATDDASLRQAADKALRDGLDLYPRMTNLVTMMELTPSSITPDSTNPMVDLIKDAIKAEDFLKPYNMLKQFLPFPNLTIPNDSLAKGLPSLKKIINDFVNETEY